MPEPLHPEVALLSEALELPPEQRALHLQSACGDDISLRQQVEMLLQAHEQAEHFLEEPAAGLPLGRPNLGNAALPETFTDRIERYRLVEKIGEGGCGVVYLAEQEEPVRRRVAIKVIKLGMDTRQVIARFEAERQALALMDHPNIAKVLDGGATESGRPYFVMELVRGVKITDFCDEHQVSAEERLKIFVQVCQALQHAHQKGVIHRDIKPSNILVTLHDGRPVPKVIDFGIAKATQGRLTDHTVFTAFEQFLGTPAYMSPEQAVMGGQDIDTRSDIYSLGALLYELLAGTPPFDPKTLLAGGLDEMRRTIREQEPLRPSTRLGAMGAEVLTASARLRRTDASKLIHLLSGDLDWIVMKCLEKDRTRRYETANGLASDLQRVLNHEPIAARPPSRFYRLRKLAQRNRVTFVVGGILVVALLAVAISSSIAAWRVAGARQAEVLERQKAESANRQLRGTISLLELDRAEDFFRDHDAARGVAHLAAVLRRDPSNHLAANRLVSALLHRDWALPLTAPFRHLGRVDSVWFSPDGRQVLSASHDRTAKTWDTATGAVRASIRHRGRILQARFNSDGTRFVTASADGTAQIWDAASGAPYGPSLTHTSLVYWAEFSADGRNVVTASADFTARVWDAATGKRIRELSGHNSPVVIARFSPKDPKRIVTGGSHGSIRLWSVDTLLPVEDRRTNLTALAFSPNGNRLVVACADGVARLWDAETGRSIAPPLIHNGPIAHAAFSPNSQLVLTASQDGTARLWEVETGRPFGQPLVHQGGVIFGAFSPDGRTVVTTSMDNTTRRWDVQTGTPLGQPLREHERILHADFSPDGRRLVTASYNWNVRLWDIQPRRATALELNAGKRVSSVMFSPDGKSVLTSGEGGIAQQWDARSGQLHGEPIQQRGWIHTAAFSPDGRQIVSASHSRSTHVREALSGKIIAGPFQHSNGLWFACFSPDGGRIVTTSVDATARIWNARDGQPITPPLQHPSSIRQARFSPDGKRVLTLSKDYARVWDALTGAAITDPLMHIDHVNWAEFSPDGERVVTASTDNTACLWDIRTGKPAAPLLRHARTVVQAVFSPDGRRVATASIDRTARIWDARTGQALTTALDHPRDVESLGFTHDGRRLLTVGWRGSARMWEVETGRPLTEWFDGGRSHAPAFDATGERVALGGVGARVWTVPFAPVPVPEWFVTFAESVAGVRLDTRGAVELVPWLESDEAAWRQPGGDVNDFYHRLTAWFLADPTNRPLGPF